MVSMFLRKETDIVFDADFVILLRAAVSFVPKGSE